eukprot:189727-Hanusia_phi.AAC.2
MEKIIFACDTETYGVDPTAESPVGKGRCACFSLYGGPLVDFKSVGQTVELTEEDVSGNAEAEGAVAQGQEGDSRSQESNARVDEDA